MNLKMLFSAVVSVCKKVDCATDVSQGNKYTENGGGYRSGQIDCFH